MYKAKKLKEQFQNLKAARKSDWDNDGINDLITSLSKGLHEVQQAGINVKLDLTYMPYTKEYVSPGQILLSGVLIVEKAQYNVKFFKMNSSSCSLEVVPSSYKEDVNMTTFPRFFLPNDSEMESLQEFIIKTAAIESLINDADIMKSFGNRDKKTHLYSTRQINKTLK